MNSREMGAVHFFPCVRSLWLNHWGRRTHIEVYIVERARLHYIRPSWIRILKFLIKHSIRETSIKRWKLSVRYPKFCFHTIPPSHIIHRVKSAPSLSPGPPNPTSFFLTQNGAKSLSPLSARIHSPRASFCLANEFHLMMFPTFAEFFRQYLFRF